LIKSDIKIVMIDLLDVLQFCIAQRILEIVLEDWGWGWGVIRDEDSSVNVNGIA